MVCVWLKGCLVAVESVFSRLLLCPSYEDCVAQKLKHGSKHDEQMHVAAALLAWGVYQRCASIPVQVYQYRVQV